MSDCDSGCGCDECKINKRLDAACRERDEAKGMMESAFAELRELKAGTLVEGVVTRVYEDDGSHRASVLAGNVAYDVLANEKYPPGVGVVLTTVPGGIGGIVRARPLTPSKSAVIDKVFAKKTNKLYVSSTATESSGGSELVYSRKMPERGDVVLLEGSYVVDNIGKPDAGRHEFESPNVSWSDVGGLDAAKEALIAAIEFPARYRKTYEFYGSPIAKGILLYGPPGNGKTLLAKAAGHSVGKAGRGKRGAFRYVKGPEFLTKWVGEAEERIRGEFDSCRQHLKETGVQPILFIDEAESIVGKRGSMKSCDVDRTIVPTFLSEMDGLDAGGPIVILATNRQDMLDEAVTRPGRIDVKVFVPKPDAAACEAIFTVHLKGVPLSEVDSCRKTLAKEVAEKLFDAASRGGCDVSGALIAGIVREAKMMAIMRDIKSKRKPAGVRKDNVLCAMDKLVSDEAGVTKSQKKYSVPGAGAHV